MTACRHARRHAQPGARGGAAGTKRFELLTRAEASKISLTEIDLSDEDAIAAALPKWVP